jgi:hypothetical protein
MICSECGSEMFLCGTFGAHWNCECGRVVEGAEETSEIMWGWIQKEREKNLKRDPVDINLGACLRGLREECNVTLKLMSELTGLSSTELSDIELGRVEIKEATKALYRKVLTRRGINEKT